MSRLMPGHASSISEIAPDEVLGSLGRRDGIP